MATIADLKAKALRRIDLTSDGPVPADQLRALPGISYLRSNGSFAQLVVEGSTAELFAAAAPYRISGVVGHQPDLEEIFLTYYGKT